MPNIVNLQNLESRLSYRSKIRDTGTRRVRSAIVFLHGNLTQIGAGTTDYSASAMTFRTQDVNGFLIPEAIEGDFFSVLMPSTGSGIMVGSSASLSAGVGVTGAADAQLKRRLIFPFSMPAGRIAGNLRIYSLGSVNPPTITPNGLDEETNNTIVGVTGTHSIQANFGRLSAAGALTQILTVTQSRTLIDTHPSGIATNILSSTTGTTADDDMLYLEMILRVNQTARTSGVTNVSATLTSGWIKHVTTPGNVLFVEFDLA